MGLFASKFNKLFAARNKPCRAIVLGLDNAGKTTMLYKLKLNETCHTVPTIGFNGEQIHYKGLEMTMWDVGGQDKIRALWRHYYEGTDLLIFVVDSNDKSRIDIAREELEHLLTQPELSDAVLLVYANKQDVPNAMPIRDLAQQLGLLPSKSNPSVLPTISASSGVRGRDWFVQASSAVSGAGLYEGLDWAADALIDREKRTGISKGSRSVAGVPLVGGMVGGVSGFLSTLLKVK